jgi:hypothetical protein
MTHRASFPSGKRLSPRRFTQQLSHENQACTRAMAFGTLVLAEHLCPVHRSESNFPKRAVT